MRTVVFVKQVPEVSELTLDPETRRLRREGVDSMMNPFDRRAVLEARRLRDQVGGTITAVTMGPPAAESILRECLGLGVDRVVHLSDRGFAGADTLATARALARATERFGFDLVLAGRYSIDSDTGQVGPEVAALLSVPFLGGVRRLDVELREDRWRVDAECEGDGGFILVEGPLPLVATCTDRWKTRIPRILPDEAAAAGAAVEVWSIADLGGDPQRYGQAGSPTRVEEVQAVFSERKRVRLVHRDDPPGVVARMMDVFAHARREGARRSVGRAISHARPAGEAPAIWVLGERGAEGEIRPVTWELLGAADHLAGSLGASTAVFLLEPWRSDGRGAHGGDAAGIVAELGAHGADVLLESTASYPATVGVLVEAIRAHRPRVVLAPATALGRDLVPQIAARLGLGLTGDAIGVRLDEEGRLQQLKPAFGGQVVAPIVSRTRPEMVTLRAGVLDPVSPDRGRRPATTVRLPEPAGSPHVLRCRCFEA